MADEYQQHLNRLAACTAFVNANVPVDPEWVWDIWGDIFGWRGDDGFWHPPTTPMSPQQPIIVGPRPGTPSPGWGWIVPQPPGRDETFDWEEWAMGGFPSAPNANRPPTIPPESTIDRWRRGINSLIGNLDAMAAAAWVMGGGFEIVCTAAKNNLLRGLAGVDAAIGAGIDKAFAAVRVEPPPEGCVAANDAENAKLNESMSKMQNLRIQLAALQADIESVQCTNWAGQPQNYADLLDLATRLDNIEALRKAEQEKIDKSSRRQWEIGVGDCAPGDGNGYGSRQWYICGGKPGLTPRGVMVPMELRHTLGVNEPPAWNSVSQVLTYADGSQSPGGPGFSPGQHTVYNLAGGRLESVPGYFTFPTDESVVSLRMEVIYSGLEGVPCYFVFTPPSGGEIGGGGEAG